MSLCKNCIVGVQTEIMTNLGTVICSVILPMMVIVTPPSLAANPDAALSTDVFVGGVGGYPILESCRTRPLEFDNPIEL